MGKIDLTDLQTYYYHRDRFDRSLMGRLTHRQRLLLHPLMLAIIKARNKSAGFEIDVLYDHREATGRPVIFAITHIGKFDIEICSEVVRDHYYLLSGDYENMKGTIEEVFLGLNGVVYLREDDKADRALSKEKMIRILENGGSIMYFPEGQWNLSPNLPVLPCAWGVIDVAMRSDAVIIPIGIEQYGNRFVVCVGNNFDPSGYSDKATAIDDLRSVMAELKWDIWSSVPPQQRASLDPADFDRNIQELLSQWPGITLGIFERNIFKPKGVYTEKEVFQCLENVEITRDNCFLLRTANVKKKLGQCSKKTRPPALLKNQATRP